MLEHSASWSKTGDREIYTVVLADVGVTVVRASGVVELTSSASVAEDHTKMGDTDTLVHGRRQNEVSEYDTFSTKNGGTKSGNTWH